NPYFPLFWWLVFLLAAWSVLCDDLAMLPVAAFAGSYCLQAHNSYLGLVGGVAAALVVVLAVDGWRPRGGRGPRRAAGGGGGGRRRGGGARRGRRAPAGRPGPAPAAGRLGGGGSGRERGGVAAAVRRAAHPRPRQHADRPGGPAAPPPRAPR